MPAFNAVIPVQAGTQLRVPGRLDDQRYALLESASGVRRDDGFGLVTSRCVQPPFRLPSPNPDTAVVSL